MTISGLIDISTLVYVYKSRLNQLNPFVLLLSAILSLALESPFGDLSQLQQDPGARKTGLCSNKNVFTFFK